METKDWIIAGLGVVAIGAIAYIVKQAGDIELIEGSVVNDSDIPNISE